MSEFCNTSYTDDAVQQPDNVMFSNLYDFHVSVPDKGDVNSFDFNAEQESNNITEKPFWNCTLISINQPAQNAQNYDEVTLDAFDIDDTTGDKLLENDLPLCDFDGMNFMSPDTDTADSIDIDIIYAENILNKSTSNQTLCSINEPFQDTLIDENFDITNMEFLDNLDVNDNIMSYLEEEDYNLNDDFSMYEELSDLETILNGIMEEGVSNSMDDSFCNNQSNPTDVASDTVYEVTIANKVFYIKDARVVLERLPMSVVLEKTKKSKAMRSKLKKASSCKLFDRFCPLCKNTTETSSFRNDIKCKICKTKLLFQCKECNAKYDTYGRMMYHIKTKLCKFQISEKNCRKCGKNYASDEALKRHNNYCKKEFNFRCDLCSYKCKNQKDLNKHYLSNRHNLQISRAQNVKVETSSNDIDAFNCCEVTLQSSEY